MNDERWRQIEELYHAARVREPTLVKTESHAPTEDRLDIKYPVCVQSTARNQAFIRSEYV
jgi:hypothetical protein